MLHRMIPATTSKPLYCLLWFLAGGCAAFFLLLTISFASIERDDETRPLTTIEAEPLQHLSDVDENHDAENQTTERHREVSPFPPLARRPAPRTKSANIPADTPDFNSPYDVYMSMARIGEKCLARGNTGCSIVCETMKETLLETFVSISGGARLSPSAHLPQFSGVTRNVWRSCHAAQ